MARRRPVNDVTIPTTPDPGSAVGYPLTPWHARTVYAYGMVVWSTVHRIAGQLPCGDGYGEIAESWSVPAGEAANGAVLLSRWGHRVRLDGALLGRSTVQPLRAALGAHGVDVSGLAFDESFEGYRDQVYTDGNERTVYGQFRGHRASGLPRWLPASAVAIGDADLVLIDPWFAEDSERAALLCQEAGRPYVTLDCRHDTTLHRYAAANVVSREYRRAEYPDTSDAALTALFGEAGAGLCVFTNGRDPLQYFRRGVATDEHPIPQIQARISVGAGDAFRAAIAHAISQGWGDRSGVAFAARTAAAVCRTAPLAASPPELGGRPPSLRSRADPGTVLEPST